MQQVLDSAVTETLLYRKQTKHHFHRYWAKPVSPRHSIIIHKEFDTQHGTVRRQERG